MDEVVHTFAAAGVQIITLAAAFLLLLGFAISSVKWIMQASSEGISPAYSTYRMKIGRTILIGLEVLLAAMSSPLRLYHQNFVSLISFQALAGACRGHGADGCDCTGGAID